MANKNSFTKTETYKQAVAQKKVFQDNFVEYMHRNYGDQLENGNGFYMCRLMQTAMDASQKRSIEAVAGRNEDAFNLLPASNWFKTELSNSYESPEAIEKISDLKDSGYFANFFLEKM